MSKAQVAVATLLTIVLSGCANAETVTPDSKNPAHCFAAFQYGRTVMLRSSRPEVYGALVSTARAMYEMRQIAGTDAQRRGKVEGETLLTNYAGQPEVIERLLRECYRKQDGDAAFRAANKSGVLMDAARKIDPECKNDIDCVEGRKFSTWAPKVRTQ